MNDLNTTTELPEEKKKPVANNDDWYYETVDADGDYDGYVHVVCTLDGSELKIPIQDLLSQLKKK